MSDPRTPGDPGSEAASDPATTAPDALPTAVPPPPTPVSPEQASAADSPTQAWPPLTPSSESAPSAASWGSAPAASPYEPADRLPEARIGSVADGATVTASGTGATSRSRSGLRWGLAVAGILIVVAASALIVTLAGGRPTASVAVGYMPATTVQYTEIRFDLPGDQRQKLAAFLANFPSFKDQTQLEPKLDEIFDRIVRAATKDKQAYTTDIKPWFGGQIAIGAGVPSVPQLGAAAPTAPMSGADNVLMVVTISDRAKAAAWLSSIGSALTRSTYNGADLFTGSATDGSAAAVTDKVMLGGSVEAVKAAIDSKGAGALAQDPDFKAAFGQVDRDYATFAFMKVRAYADALVKTMALARPGVLEGTQLDETVISILPPWQASTSRFETDALVSSMAYPSWAIGYDATNRRSTLLDHIPSKTIFYAESHDIGPALTALIGKFRALPETKAAFAQFDQAMSLLGGFDAVMGWWGDTAFVVTPGADGVIGAGLVIKPRDKAAADHLLTTLRGFLALAGSSTGINVRDEDHGGTKITILDFSAAPGMTPGSLPPGYKAELAWAVTNDVVALGYGRDFVASVLDAGPGSNLAADDRFKKLLGRVGEENLGMSFLDVTAIRGLIEPLVKGFTPADAWTRYETDFKPYLEHLDAVVSTVRKDGALDRGQAAITAR